MIHRLLDHIEEVQYHHWKFWANSLCTLTMLVAVPGTLVLMTRQEILSARKLKKREGVDTPPELRMGSTLLYSKFVATERNYAESTARLLRLRNQENREPATTRGHATAFADEGRTDRVVSQQVARRLSADRAWSAVTAYHALHSRASALMSLHAGLKPGWREWWKLATMFVERALLACAATLLSTRALAQSTFIVSVTIVFTLSATLLQPFTTANKNRMDLVTRVTSTLNALAAVAL